MVSGHGVHNFWGFTEFFCDPGSNNGVGPFDFEPPNAHVEDEK